MPTLNCFEDAISRPVIGPLEECVWGSEMRGRPFSEDRILLLRFKSLVCHRVRAGNVGSVWMAAEFGFKQAAPGPQHRP